MEKEYTKKDSDYLKKNPTWHIEDSEWKAKQIKKMIDRNNLAPGTIAEIGCGAGEILLQLQEKNSNKQIIYSGYDISPDALKLASTRQRKGLTFYHEDLLQKDIHFDLLLMIDVFEHVEDYIGFIRKATSKSTYKIYHIPLDISLNGIIRNIPGKTMEDVGHLHYFTKDTALSILQYTGQTIIDHFYTPGAIELANKNLKKRILNVFRKIMFGIAPNLTVKLFGGYSLMVLTK